MNSVSLWQLVIFSMFESFVAPTGFTKEGDFAVLRGTSMIIPCRPPEEEASEGEDNNVMDSKWTTSSGEELDDPRYHKLNSGDLEITEIQVDDSGIYNCATKILQDSEGNGTMSNQTYPHKVIVYDLAGQKFITTVDISYNEDINETIVNDMKRFLFGEVCVSGRCEPQEVKMGNCRDEDNYQKCSFEISYQSIMVYADDSCDEECVKAGALQRLRDAEKSLRSHVKGIEDPDNEIHPIMSSFKTHHLIVCNPGFHLLKGHKKRCFPCPPGTYSGPNSTRCHLCGKGKYQLYYGKRTCEECPAGQTTASIGANEKSDCVSNSLEIGGQIKQGFDSLVSLFEFGK